MVERSGVSGRFGAKAAFADKRLILLSLFHIVSTRRFRFCIIARYPQDVTQELRYIANISHRSFYCRCAVPYGPGLLGGLGDALSVAAGLVERRLVGVPGAGVGDP
jgi:hypothetical protein